MDKLFLPYKIVKEHFEQDMTDTTNADNTVANTVVNADTTVVTADNLVSNNRVNNNNNLVSRNRVNNSVSRRRNRMCNNTMMYYFVSLVIMLYALSLALDRVRSNPRQNEFVSMFIVLSSLFCSPCYLVFEFASMLLSSRSPSNMAPRIVFVR